MRKRIASWMAVLMIFTLMGGAAHAETTEVTATVAEADGLRVIAPILPVALLPQLDGTLEAPMLVTVEETLAKGANWSLSAISSDFAGELSGDILPASSLVLGSTTVTQTLSGGTLTPNTQGGALDAAKTLYSVSQDPAVAYSGTHVSASPLTLSVPNGTSLDAYKATVTVTLISG